MDRASATARLLGGQIVQLWNKGQERGEIAEINKVEAKRIEEGVEILVDRWRSAFPGEAREGGSLGTERLRSLRRDFLALPAPQLGTAGKRA